MPKPAPNPPQARVDIYRQAVRAALVGVAINLSLGVVKLAGGVLSGSFALVSDAVNSFGDVVSSVVVLVALIVAQRPADEEHPYGHTRAESIASTNVAVLIIVSALAIAWEALRRLGTTAEVPPAWTLWIAGGNVVIKELLYRYNVYVGRKSGSTALIANAWDHRSDAFASLAVLVGLAVVWLGGPDWHWADKVAALVVAGAIVYTAAKIFHTGASELMDLQADDAMVAAVRAAARQTPGVVGVETLWLRKSGLEYFADIHIEVDAHLTVAEGHRIGHVVKDYLLAEFPYLRDVLVHLEPSPHDY